LSWYVYLVVCSDGTYYCGASNNVPKRVKTHNRGKGARYTRTRRPVELLCTSPPMEKGAALSFERKVKKAKRRYKPQIVREGSLDSVVSKAWRYKR